MSTSAIAIARATQDARHQLRLFTYGQRLTDAEARLAFGMALVDSCKTSIDAERLLQRLAAHIDDKRSGKAAQFAQVADAQLRQAGGKG